MEVTQCVDDLTDVQKEVLNPEEEVILERLVEYLVTVLLVEE